MNILLQYLKNHRWYIIGSIIIINIITQLYKLSIYRNLTEFIKSITILIETDSILLTFFVKLFMIHFLQNIIKYLLEKIIAYGIKDLLHKLTQCIMYKTMEFFK